MTTHPKKHQYAFQVCPLQILQTGFGRQTIPKKWTKLKQYYRKMISRHQSLKVQCVRYGKNSTLKHSKDKHYPQNVKNYQT